MHGVEQYMVRVHSKYYPLPGLHAARTVTPTYTKRQDKTVEFIDQIIDNR